MRALLALLLIGCATPEVAGSQAPPPFQLTVSELQQGMPMLLTASGVPDVMVYFVVESPLNDPCPPVLAGACFDLVGFRLLGSSMGSNGVATWRGVVPPSVPEGHYAQFQAVYMVEGQPEFSSLAGTIVGNPGDGPPLVDDPPPDADAVLTAGDAP
jgi:hypothetical protein